ncbi:TraR/DksA C4-type zinc finger protein [Archangium lansingense]|uniref:TraR/DksA C4-type zinc finger protein n=1 Tax=Archangium lansingense TaxID=2995310 RepID=A0ABT4ANZ1_9BACT|nr:TraR/DksA C4-type zinc finger protein [Archangium lansinium]MCY1082522.1 TraR/DksA C4-type zinc finger protein [Archangium lansinium]
MATETTEVVHCGVCEAEIPQARLKAMPDTLVCVRCSEEMGGEFELEVTISATGKAGSLKKTGQNVEVKRKRKTLR